MLVCVMSVCSVCMTMSMVMRAVGLGLMQRWLTVAGHLLCLVAGDHTLLSQLGCSRRIVSVLPAN